MRTIIRANLAGDNTCIALGITARAPSPILTMCRQLIGAGFNPAGRLDCYRDGVLALTVNSIGHAAGLEIGSHGLNFVAFRGRRAASPIAPLAQPAAQHRQATRITPGVPAP